MTFLPNLEFWNISFSFKGELGNVAFKNRNFVSLKYIDYKNFGNEKKIINNKYK